MLYEKDDFTVLTIFLVLNFLLLASAIVCYSLEAMTFFYISLGLLLISSLFTFQFLIEMDKKEKNNE